MHIYDLMNGARLTELVRDRYISMVESADGHYLLYNYTEKATYERVWTPETRQCRGLVTDRSGNVVCLPFDKFSNLDEPGFPESSLEVVSLRPGTFEVTDKLDGSCIFIWYDDESGRWRCTTRGSFTSSQAQAAQAWLDARANWSDWPTPDQRAGHRFTFIAEWCAPDNRVVLRYEQPELRLIGVKVWPASGGCYDLEHWGVTSWAHELGLPVVPLVAATLDELTARQQTDTGVEGWVLRWPDGHRVKVKTADYVRLHKALSGFGPKQVYEAALASLGNHEMFDAYLAGLPEEIRPDAEAYYERMDADVTARWHAAWGVFSRLEPLLAQGRGVFARAVVAECGPAQRAVVFAMADAKDEITMLWKQLDLRALFGADADAEPDAEPVAA